MKMVTPARPASGGPAASWGSTARCAFGAWLVSRERGVRVDLEADGLRELARQGIPASVTSRCPACRLPRAGWRTASASAAPARGLACTVRAKRPRRSAVEYPATGWRCRPGRTSAGPVGVPMYGQLASGRRFRILHIRRTAWLQAGSSWPAGGRSRSPGPGLSLDIPASSMAHGRRRLSHGHNGSQNVRRC